MVRQPIVALGALLLVTIPMPGEALITPEVTIHIDGATFTGPLGVPMTNPAPSSLTTVTVTARTDLTYRTVYQLAIASALDAPHKIGFEMGPVVAGVAIDGMAMDISVAYAHFSAITAEDVPCEGTGLITLDSAVDGTVLESVIISKGGTFSPSDDLYVALNAFTSAWEGTQVPFWLDYCTTWLGEKKFELSLESIPSIFFGASVDAYEWSADISQLSTRLHVKYHEPSNWMGALEIDADASSPIAGTVEGFVDLDSDLVFDGAFSEIERLHVWWDDEVSFAMLGLRFRDCDGGNIDVDMELWGFITLNLLAWPEGPPADNPCDHIYFENSGTWDDKLVDEGACQNAYYIIVPPIGDALNECYLGPYSWVSDPCADTSGCTLAPVIGAVGAVCGAVTDITEMPCIPVPPADCPTGGSFPECECPPPTNGTLPSCETDVDCPEPLEGTVPDCSLGQTDCPPPTTGTFPDCDPNVDCPPPTTGSAPGCSACDDTPFEGGAACDPCGVFEGYTLGAYSSGSSAPTSSVSLDRRPTAIAHSPSSGLVAGLATQTPCDIEPDCSFVGMEAVCDIVERCTGKDGGIEKFTPSLSSNGQQSLEGPPVSLAVTPSFLSTSLGQPVPAMTSIQVLGCVPSPCGPNPLSPDCITHPCSNPAVSAAVCPLPLPCGNQQYSALVQTFDSSTLVPQRRLSLTGVPTAMGTSSDGNTYVATMTKLPDCVALPCTDCLPAPCGYESTIHEIGRSSVTPNRSWTTGGIVTGLSMSGPNKMAVTAFDPCKPPTPDCLPDVGGNGFFRYLSLGTGGFGSVLQFRGTPSATTSDSAGNTYISYQTIDCESSPPTEGISKLMKVDVGALTVSYDVLESVQASALVADGSSLYGVSALTDQQFTVDAATGAIATGTTYSLDGNPTALANNGSTRYIGLVV